MNGVTAFNFHPAKLIEVASSGVSNWVSTYNSDANRTDWLQAGWRFYWWDSTPKQYVEWCIDCSGSQGTYEVHDQFATQNWGTTVDYWIDRVGNACCCAYPSGILRYCVEYLHSTPVVVLAKSEVHDGLMNPLDTTFDQVRYKDPSDSIWKLFDNQVIWTKDFPYDVEIFSNSHFRAHRMIPLSILLVLLLALVAAIEV